MPFKSKAQQGYICATDKKLCKHFAESTPKAAYKKLPEHISDKKKKKN